jgi:hypothetical protein
MFKTEIKIFKQNIDGDSSYIFNSMIVTDGVSCSIIFIRKDLALMKQQKTRAEIMLEVFQSQKFLRRPLKK